MVVDICIMSLQTLSEKLERELMQLDQTILLEIDQLVIDQQATLQVMYRHFMLFLLYQRNICNNILSMVESLTLYILN